MKWSKAHPFPVQAHFEKSIILTFAVPWKELNNIIPDTLSIDTFNNTWGFVAIAMVETKQLRPQGFPKWLGNNFHLIGYRIFVRYKNLEGKNLRGLYILKTETNKKKMEFLGNIFTHYNYRTIDLNTKRIDEDDIKIESIASKFNLVMNEVAEATKLPPRSPFSSWAEARKFAGPLPHTFHYSTKKEEMTIVRGLRKNWKPKPLFIKSYNFDFLDKLGFSECHLANAFIIKDIPYLWEKGYFEKWT